MALLCHGFGQASVRQTQTALRVTCGTAVTNIFHYIPKEQLAARVYYLHLLECIPKEDTMRLLNALFLSAALVLPLAGTAFAEGTFVTVTGEATVSATPDQATISLGVTTNGATAAEAMAANSKALSAVLDRLKAAGIDERDLQTANLSLMPNWVGYDGSSVPSIADYTASNMLNVRVRALDQLGSILDASIADGANTLNGITFELAVPGPTLDEARKAAVVDARARAMILVEAAGSKLGNIVSITENVGYNSPMQTFRTEASDGKVPVATGQIGMMSSVTVTYELAQ